jgi:hypothetical protein
MSKKNVYNANTEDEFYRARLRPFSIIRNLDAEFRGGPYNRARALFKIGWSILGFSAVIEFLDRAILFSPDKFLGELGNASISIGLGSLAVGSIVAVSEMVSEFTNNQK